MKIPRAGKKAETQKRHYNPARARETVGGKSGRPSGARWVGEHLGCSPCGRVACRALTSTVGLGPEVLLSLLPLANPTLYLTGWFSSPGRVRGEGSFEVAPPRLQAAVALEGRRIARGSLDGLGFLGLQALDQHPV